MQAGNLDNSTQFLTNLIGSRLRGLFDSFVGSIWKIPERLFLYAEYARTFSGVRVVAIAYSMSRGSF